MTPGGYRLALDRIVRPLLVRMIVIVSRILAQQPDRAAARVEITEKILPLIRAARVSAHDTAITFLTAQLVAQGGTGEAYHPPIVDYPEKAARALVDDALSAQEKRESTDASVVEQIGSRTVRHVEQAARETITRSVEDTPKDPHQRQPVAWARQLTGTDNCAFCVMLTSRGAIYPSQRVAQFNGSELDAYHDRCDCIAVPVYNRAVWPGWAEATRLRDLWNEATKTHSGGNAINALRRELARMRRDGETIAPNIRGAETATPGT